jgi:molybdopterin-guanine dinucleotide biosynthesis protein A
MRVDGVAGIVVCGGLSSRMGRPKEWLPFGDELMLPRVVRLLSEVVSPIVIVAAAGRDLPPLPGDVIVTRDPLPDRGPLQGLAAGLAALPEAVTAAYVSACDVPLLRPAFVRRMVQLLGPRAACVPSVEGRLHPLAAVYRREVATVAEQLLAKGRHGPADLCRAVNARLVTAVDLADVDPDLQSLRNVNTPDDYAAAVRDRVGG